MPQSPPGGGSAAPGAPNTSSMGKETGLGSGPSQHPRHHFGLGRSAALQVFRGFQTGDLWLGGHQQNVKPLDIAWCPLKPIKSPWNPLFPDHLWKQGILRAFKGFQGTSSYVWHFADDAMCTANPSHVWRHLTTYPFARPPTPRMAGLSHELQCWNVSTISCVAAWYWYAR